jgi:hypothetical protein
MLSISDLGVTLCLIDLWDLIGYNEILNKSKDLFCSLKSK